MDESAWAGDLRVVPIPRSSPQGGIDWDELALHVAHPGGGGPSMEVPEGWIELPFAGYDQGLLLKESSRFAGTLVQLTVRRLGPADDVTDHVSDVTPPTALALGVEPWSAGGWEGVHLAWSYSLFGMTTLRRVWLLGADGGETVEVVSQYNAYMGPRLGPVIDAMVSRLTPAPSRRAGTAEHSSLHQAAMVGARLDSTAHHDLPDAFHLTTSDLRWVLRHGAQRGDLWGQDPQAASRALRESGLADAAHHLTKLGREVADCLIRADGAPASSRFRMAGRVGTQSVTGLLVDLGDSVLVHRSLPSEQSETSENLAVYRRWDAPEAVLRVAGHRPCGPSDVPVNLLPLIEFTRRLADSAEPMPAAIPEGATVSRTLTPQDIHRWWTADWNWWWLVTEEPQNERARDGVIHRGIRVLHVHGFGHYEWRVVGDKPGAQGTMVELRPIDGLSLFHAVDEVLRPRS